jgi:hypothetical protein
VGFYKNIGVENKRRWRPHIQSSAPS